jgi:polyhydroxyalkanoate synthase
VFTISWRNPTGAQRDWNYDTYAQAVIEATDVIRQVSGSPDVNIMGGCLGGMTAAVVQAHLAALEERRINSVTMTVTMLDCDSDGRMFLFASPATLALAKAVSKPRGVIEGWQLGQMFAWLRPNDLVWNYWANNYLLGQDPPAFDILAWNADQTRLSYPNHRGLGYYLNPETPPDAGQWLAGAQRREGSWWEHWAGWLAARSGKQTEAPESPGSQRSPALEPAPGSYVRQ